MAQQPNSNRRRWTIMAALVVILAAIASPAGAQDDAAPPTNAVQVTQNTDPLRAHSSPQINVHPETGELVVVEGEARQSRRCKVHLSEDDGRTWVRGGDLMPAAHSDCTLSGEYGPYVTSTFAADGTLYVAFVASRHPAQAQAVQISHPLPQQHRHVYLARSEDGGRTFDTTMVYEADFADSNRYLNKGPMLAVDPSDSSRVYVGWRQGDIRTDAKLLTNVAASDDGGETFSDPVDISQEAGGDYPALAVTPDGTLHAVYWERDHAIEGEPPREIMYTRSADGGASFTEPTTIDPGNQSTSRPPLLAADADNGNLYMVWFANQEVRNVDAEEPQRHDILLRASRDGGDTWQDRRVLNEDLDANQFDPGIAVAPSGHIDVAWYDFRHSPTPPADVSGQGGEDGVAHVYYTYSTDGGETFAPDQRISDRGIDRSVGVWSNNISSKFNIGVAATDDRAYFAWQDTRNADPELQAEDVYMASRPHAARDDGDTSGLMARVQGAGIALTAGGLLLAGVARRVRRR
ncbi:MAG: hypothetical protein BRC31_07125 [Actinobacteria bacterium QS_5_72_10]|nr:MAG: hypothetical protein BRC31_07125 [Actinobacteria bacterium QS_5_72_10]